MARIKKTKKAPEPKKLGCPTKYRPEHDKRAYELALLGLTNPQIAEELEICAATLAEWRKKHPSFSDALTKGKTSADGKVARALYRRALGFYYDETVLESVGMQKGLESPENASDANGLVKTKITRKYIAPDSGAALSWLKNRQGAIWRDKQVLEFENMTDDQLDKVIAELQKRANGNAEDPKG